ncbi:hypothetical protein NKI80_25245 [Mesorhizobium sp. M0387]|uniref:hypothetical protein n=1 Tax=Mesorhizobium sp. M0387 TaxID=2956940 RepID=UPI0033364A8D
MRSFTDASQEGAIADAKALRRFKVQKVGSIEELSRLHLQRLVRLANSGVDEARWAHLKQCDGSGCWNISCSAACVFGERREINRFNRQTAIVHRLDERPEYFTTVIDPHYFKSPGELHEFSISGLFQSIRRRLRAAPDVWKSARISGGVHIAYDRNQNGREFWSPHVHLTISVDATKEEVRQVLMPPRVPPPELVGEKFAPVTVKVITNLANAIAYSTKAEVDARGAVVDGRGNLDRKWFNMPMPAKVEHDLWLLNMKPRDRTFLSGMKVSRGGVLPVDRR